MGPSAERNLHPRGEGRDALRLRGGLWVPIIIFGSAMNLLTLTGPLFMLQVYDRVLASRSEETLAVLSVLALFLFAAMGVLDHVRARIVTRMGADLQERLDERVFRGHLAAVRLRGRDLSAPHDLTRVRRVLCSPIALACLDLPWAPIFAAVIFLFHPVLGIISILGCIVLIGVALRAQRRVSVSSVKAGESARRESRMAREFSLDAEALHGLGMSISARTRWVAQRRQALAAEIETADRIGEAGSLGRTLRMIVQSVILGTGALLVLRGELSAGAVLAASILVGRSLGPVEQVIGHWTSCLEAMQAWRRLRRLIRSTPEPQHGFTVPPPEARLDVADLSVSAPSGGRRLVRGISFSLGPGEAIGIIGPSGSGKSVLLRALAGTWTTTEGAVLFGGVRLDHFDPDRLGRLLGYLPQTPRLFSGTIAENIARLDADMDEAQVLRAAQKAGAHDLILGLPDGYDTVIDGRAEQLSVGQLQRIGLARAFYGDPVLLLLDEPNSALDSVGADALDRAIALAKREGRAAVISAHRPGAIRLCDRLLVLRHGVPAAYGPTRDVLRDVWGVRHANRPDAPAEPAADIARPGGAAT